MRGVIEDVMTAIGIAPDILKAIAQAELDPTSANLNKVVAAYAGHGQIPPPKLMAALIAENHRRHPEDRYSSFVAGNVLPWVLLLGAAGLVLLARRRR